MALFKEAAERWLDESKRRLTKLIKFTIGEAEQLILHSIQLLDLIG